ncbi:phage tail protein [Eubacteriales bacterium OttesenSCG-928-M02]|nr:phage tail protein [Eubacteriales bacterium OttesenSCG-928-M02]
MLTKEVNIADNFTFTPAVTNQLAKNLPKLTTYIEVFDEGTRIFRGRVLNLSQDMLNTYSYVCEGELAFLNDSIVRPYNWQEGGVEAYLRMLIDNHNEQVDEARQFVVRNVTVIDPNDYIVRASSEYPTTLSEMTAKLTDNLGGYFVLERIDGVTYLDYLEDSPYLSNQTIRLGENLLDLNFLARGEDFATAIIPLGAKQEVADSTETVQENSRLTIAEVNEGQDYIYDADAVAEYGFIFKTVVHDDVNVAQNLLTKGRYDLAYAINPISSIEVQCVDLKKLGVDTDNIRFMDYVKIESPPHGIEGTLLVVKMDTDLLSPANNSLTIGSDYGTFTKSNANLGQRLTTVEDNYISGQTISDVNDVIKNLWTAISQSESNIMLQVAAEYISQTQYGTDIENLSTRLEQTNSSFEFTFNQMNQTIQNINNELQTQFNEQIKYIRFENGNIILGMLGNDMILQQSNDRISFLQRGVEVAYFSDNKLYITHGEFLNSLTLGNFGFLPRANGNLSFRRMK